MTYSRHLVRVLCIVNNSGLRNCKSTRSNSITSQSPNATLSFLSYFSSINFVQLSCTMCEVTFVTVLT